MENNQAQGTNDFGENTTPQGERFVAPLNFVAVGVGWDSCNIDIDCSVVLEGGGVSELVFFGNLDDRAKSVHLFGDHLGCMSIYDCDDGCFFIHLDRVPDQYNRLVFVFTIYNPHVNSFGSVSGMYLNVYNADNAEKLVEYRLNGDYSQDSSLVVAEARRVGSGWEFFPIGEGTNIKDLEPLRDYVVGKHW